MKRRDLQMWTIYDHPSDFPGGFIARRWWIGNGQHGPTGDTITAPTLKEIRTELRGRGLVQIPRSKEDDPRIVEVWT